MPGAVYLRLSPDASRPAVAATAADLAPSVPVALPWRPLGGIVLACLVTAVLASVILAALLLRRHPGQTADRY